MTIESGIKSGLEQAMGIINNESRQNLFTKAYTDPMTKTYNRNMLELMRPYLDMSSVIVAIADIDDLKQVNDTYGHEAGDYVITKVASDLLATGGLIFRLGGDEFLAVYSKGDNTNVFIKGASLGWMTKSEKNSLQEAMSIADKNMYDRKMIKKGQ